MHPFDVKAHATLARAINVPIAVGETIYTKYAFRDFIEAGAVHIVQADATKLPQEPGVGLQLRSDVVAATRIG